MRRLVLFVGDLLFQDGEIKTLTLVVGIAIDVAIFCTVVYTVAHFISKYW